MFNIGYIAATLALLIILFLLVSRRVSHHSLFHQAQAIPETPQKPYTPFEWSRAPKDAVATYAVIDFQTTGLSTMLGAESKPVQVAWLILDNQLREMDRALYLVRQEERSDREAERIHHLPTETLMKYGIPEQEVMSRMFKALRDVDTIVFHNATFDLAIWRGALKRFEMIEPKTVEELGPTKDLLYGKRVFCTMTFVPESVRINETPSFLSLPELTFRLTGYSLNEHLEYDSTLVAWRNVSFTRACFEVIKSCYPEEVEKSTKSLFTFLE